MKIGGNSGFPIFMNVSKEELEFYCRIIIRSFMDLASSNLQPVFSGDEALRLPYFPCSYIISILKAVQQVLIHDKNVLDINSPVVIIGDLHGNLFDLLRVFSNFGLPPQQNFLFLGDFVDRGEFSLEVSLLIFALKVLYPENMFIIRGNHEFMTTTKIGGFADEVEQMYPHASLYTQFVETWKYIPFGALIFSSILALHGGPCPSLNSIEQLNHLNRPLESYANDPICAFFWSDPSFSFPYYEPSHRGTGFTFGQEVLCEFLQNNNLTLLIRGHECIEEGYRWSFDNQVLTIFSASNYCGITGNKGAIAKVSAPNKLETFSLYPLANIPRSSCIFETPSYSKEELSQLIVKLPCNLLKIDSVTFPLPDFPVSYPLKIKSRKRTLTNSVVILKPLLNMKYDHSTNPTKSSSSFFKSSEI